MSLLALVAVVALVILAWVTLPALMSTAAKGTAQTAADAAALAGAQDVRERAAERVQDEIPEDEVGLAGDDIDRSLTLYPLPQPMLGHGEAGRYASENGAVLEPGGYSYDVSRGRVEVVVRTREETPTGNPSRAAAAARLDVEVPTCVAEAGRTRSETTPTPEPPPEPSASPSPSVSPTPTPTPSPTPSVSYGPWWFHLTCVDKDGLVVVDVAGDDLSDLKDEAAEELEEALEPRLVE